MAPETIIAIIVLAALLLFAAVMIWEIKDDYDHKHKR